MNPVFNIIRYDKISSTNDEAKQLLQKTKLPDFTVITAEEQTKGRGQKENLWHSEYGKNLTFSIITYPDKLIPAEQFYLSKIISVGITDYLNAKQKGFKIKWPNDIYYNNKKICGILIENTITGSKIKNTVIGTGLNLNQQNFPGFLPDAVSLSNITGKLYDIDKEILILLNFIYEKYKFLTPENFTQINRLYHKSLFGINKPSKFKDKNGIFKGEIKGTLPEGKLIIQTSDKELRYYNFKEVVFLKSRQ